RADAGYPQHSGGDGMNADTWLRVATDGLPEVVKTRIVQDTREHLADAGLGSAADVEPVLGAPEDTAKEMRRLYLTEKELKALGNDRFFLFFAVFTGVWALCVLMSAFYASSALYYHLSAVAHGSTISKTWAEQLSPIISGSLSFSFSFFILLKSLTLSRLERMQYVFLSLTTFLIPFAFMTFDGHLSFVGVSYLLLVFHSFQQWRQQRQKLVRTVRLMA
ncbi:MAG: hypothetical protein Q4C89_08570, partial [Deinococcus sp.]|uniref:hypothetical protein n=1 Tax=Deinococcus sp. TaxID=47478 RepID=UPI0026DD0F84